MKINSPETIDKLVQRLRRIEGQVRGVEGMLEEGRDCREIMQQLAAIHSAVQGASRVFLQEYATSCLTELDEGSSGEGAARLEDAPDRSQKRAKIVQDMIALLDKAP